MIITDKSEPWKDKVNFVDKNNVVLGYDTYQQCCENAGWFVADKPLDRVPDDVEEFEFPIQDDWVFDPEYFQETGLGESEEGGMMAIFRLVNGKKQKFLHLFNCHNGYYSHGFKFTIDNKIKHEGSL